MKISYVLPVYNEAGYIDECFDSLLPLLRKGDEVVAVTGGNTDNTLKELEKYKDHIVIHDRGSRSDIAYGRNKGAELAMNDIIAHVDVDFYYPERRDYILENMPEYDLIYSSYENTKNGLEVKHISDYKFGDRLRLHTPTVTEKKWVSEKFEWRLKGEYHDRYFERWLRIFKSGEVKTKGIDVITTKRIYKPYNYDRKQADVLSDQSQTYKEYGVEIEI